MDNLCHTLMGGAFAEAGLKKTTRFGSAALMIASNLPDLDVLSFVSDIPAVALRRGWTHGVFAQAVLPVILTGVFMLFDRARPSVHSQGLRPLAILMLGYVGVLSHVAMDWLNTYGVRLLMPLSRDWFYGDAVFIVDPWLWLMFAAGVVLARRLRVTMPSRWAMVIASLYIVLMIVSARAARDRVVEAWTQATGRQPARVMVGPVPINPLKKAIIIDAGDHYERGVFEWWPRRIRFELQHIRKNDWHPAALSAATLDPDFRGLLVWSRFPYYELEDVGDGAMRVTLADMRFGRRSLFTATTVVAGR